ncbi:50S ribosomal protein L27 [Candidatus Microgenomates bacterium]|nr:50S ribosomal protein L27 [Candidatus Microgenomates bacterium]
MAKTKTGKTTKGSRRSNAKRLGVKIYGGEKVISGNIIVRQRGTKFHPGEGTKMGRDFTIYSIREGKVLFKQKLGNKFIVVS